MFAVYRTSLDSQHRDGIRPNLRRSDHRNDLICRNECIASHIADRTERRTVSIAVSLKSFPCGINQDVVLNMR